MFRILAATLATLCPALLCASELSKVETRWLRGVMPVLEYAQQAKLPLDIIVQPQPAAGLPPLAMAFIDGRCKLVLSMRENPEAQATLDRIDTELFNATLEMMAAHELGHCNRHVAGHWQQLPPGLPEDAALQVPAGLRPERHADYRRMQATRREEAYADLAALAWARQRHAPQFTRLRDWLVGERSRDLIPGSHHDTLAWLRLAADGHALQMQRSPFAADALWAKGFVGGE
jgi:hypothetical protein